MGSIKEINIKNWTYYFLDDMIKIKDFNLDLLKIDKKSNKNIDVYYIGYITVKDSDYIKINSANFFTLLYVKQMDTLKKKEAAVIKCGQ